MKPKLVYVAADPMTPLKLMRGQLAEMRRRGFDVTVICSPGPGLDEVARREGVTTVGIPIPRALGGVEDLRAVWRVARTLRRLRPDIVNAGTPKGGLVGMVGAAATGVPVRLYHLRGLRVETVTGWRRPLLSAAERLTSALSTRIVCNSPSLRDAYVRGRFAKVRKVFVPHQGSANGVEASRFSPTAARKDAAAASRVERGIPPDALVIGFVGRFTKDKGLDSLRGALEAALGAGIDARLLLVGDDDATDPVPAELMAWLRSHPKVLVTGFVADPAPFYGLMDLLAFPSHREGFPNVVLEAASAALPAVAFRATGCSDAVVDGVTGSLVDVGDQEGFHRAVVRYLSEPGLRKTHGEAARRRAEQDFAPARVWQALAEEYERLLAEKGLPAPEPSLRG